MSAFSCRFGLGKLVEDSQGPSPVHATDRILKTSAARTLLFAIVTFATVLFSGCANGDFIITSGQQQNYGLGGVAQSDAFVDWSKPARDQSGPTVPQYEGQSYR
jgi:hypothetical protein